MTSHNCPILLKFDPDMKVTNQARLDDHLWVVEVVVREPQ